MTDFGGKGSRRTFAARLLREVQEQALTTGALVPSIVALPVGTLAATDRLPAVSSAGVGKTLTPANFRTYILPDGDKGDITTAASGATWTIDAGAVSYAKIQNVTANTFLANATGSPATVQEIATSRIPLFGSAITGTPSASTYLRGDGTWATVASGSGDVVGPASATDSAAALYDTATGKLIKNSRLIVGDGTLGLTKSTGGSFNVTISDVVGANITASGSSPAAGVAVSSLLSATGGVSSYPSFRATANSSVGGSVYWGTYTEAFAFHGSGTVASITGLYANATQFVAGGTTTLLRAIHAEVDRSNGTLVTGVAIDVEAMGDTMTNAYGLRIGNITGGGTLNRAISTGTGLVYFGDKVNIQSSSGLEVNGTKVVGAQGATVTDPTGGTVQDSEARTAIIAIIDRLQAHGLIA